MKQQFLTLIAILALLSSCGENKRKNRQESKTAVKEENTNSQAVKAAKEEARKMDSIQQVKEHGHAH